MQLLLDRLKVQPALAGADLPLWRSSGGAPRRTCHQPLAGREGGGRVGGGGRRRELGGGRLLLLLMALRGHLLLSWRWRLR